ncbi:MAG: DUF1080 domain-containing protein [Planctomycetes bacterium]|nr:DUF1080 domain-containing protein [Planctomycetota bacterium]
MKTPILSFVAVLVISLSCRVAVGTEPELLPQKLIEQGWIQLFDGQTLFGWQPTGNAEWHIEDGAIHTAGDKPGFLVTTTEYADFELSVEFLADAKTNSGVFLRTGLQPTDPARDCYEVNIAPADNPFPTGNLVARREIAPHQAGQPAPGHWQTFHVTAEGGKIAIDLDGSRVLVHEDSAPLRIGRIALQANSGPVAFRNLRLRPLGLKSIFNGQDLTGWNTQHALAARFDITPAGELHVANGRGQLATDGQYANFILQLDCKVNGDGLNSGIFFRALPGQLTQGYESQIHNVSQDGDRSKPADFGTGGIYRRQPARRVVANDREWFTKTILADGPHCAVWVNGYPVTDWIDNRPPSDNPRKGQCLAAGIITIQAHDPTTDLLFRDLRIVELPR